MRESKVDLNGVALRAAAGDADAVTELFSELQHVARSVARRFAYSAMRLGEDPESFIDDVASETALKVLRGGLGSFRGTGSFVGFLKTIARRAALDGLRALKRRPLQAEGPRMGADDEVVNPVELVAESVDFTLGLELQRAMDVLKAEDCEAQRHLDALLANVLYGYSQDEIGVRSGVTRETANRWISEARRGLRRRLAA